MIVIGGMAPTPTMEVADGFQQDWQELLNSHPVMSMSREGKGESSETFQFFNLQRRQSMYDMLIIVQVITLHLSGRYRHNNLVQVTLYIYNQNLRERTYTFLTHDVVYFTVHQLP